MRNAELRGETGWIRVFTPRTCSDSSQLLTVSTFLAHDKSLRPLFKHYAAMDYDGLTQRGELLNLDEWNRMLADCELFDAGRHLHEALDKLLQLVVERTTGDVTLPITAKILNKRKDGRENAR